MDLRSPSITRDHEQREAPPLHRINPIDGRLALKPRATSEESAELERLHRENGAGPAHVGVPGRPGAPPDLDAFWATTMAQLRRVSFDLRRFRRSTPDGGVVTEDLSFRSWGGQVIRAYAMTWDDAVPRPFVVHAHGYRSRAVPRLDWVRAGCHVLGFDVRGFGSSVAAVPTPSSAGWLLTGAHRPETSVLRGAVCDYVRATQVAAALGVPTLRTVSHGVSLAGGLALMAEAVAPGADLLVLGVPTFGWVEGRRLLVERGSGAEVAAFLDRHPEYPEEDLHTVLSYFDAALLATAVECPTVVGLGLVDRVVPYACVQAIVERLRSRVEVMTFPESHADGPAMRAWDRFDERWLGLALGGLPPGFGNQRSAAASCTQAR